MVEDKYKKPNIAIRLLCCFPYIMPILEGLRSYGVECIQDYPRFAYLYYRKIFEPLLNIYMLPGMAIVIFLLIYFLIVRPKAKVHRFVKFHGLQAIILYMIIICFTNITNLGPPAWRMTLLGSSVINTLWWFSIITSAYSIWHALRGTMPQIPVVSPNARAHLDFDDPWKSGND